MNETILIQTISLFNQAAFMAGLLLEGMMFDWATRQFWTVYLWDREPIKVPADFLFREHKINREVVSPVLMLSEAFKHLKVKNGSQPVA